MSFYTLAFIALLAGKGVCADIQKRQQPYGWNATSSSSTSSSSSLTSLSASTSHGSTSQFTSLSLSSGLISTAFISPNGTDTILTQTAGQKSSSSLLPESWQSSETPSSPQLFTAQSSPLLTSSYHAYSTGVLPENVQTLESKTLPTVPLTTSTSLDVISTQYRLPALSSGERVSESASPSAQTAAELESQASSTPEVEDVETSSTASETEEHVPSSTWQVGISPSAYAASSALSDQPPPQPTDNSRFGSLGSLIWSGLSGSLPTDNVGAGNADEAGPTGYSGSQPSGGSFVDYSNPSPMSGYSGSSPLTGNPVGSAGSAVLTGYTETSLVIIIPTDGFGTGTGTGTGVVANTRSAHPAVTSDALTTQTGQAVSSGSGPGVFYSPKYSFSWKFNTTTPHRSLQTGVKAPTGGLPDRPLPRPSPHGNNNATCGGVTVNIPDATLDYWYTTAFDYAAATFSMQFDSNDSQTGWTLLPASTTFNVTDALQDQTTYYVASTVAAHSDSTSVLYYTTVDTSPTPVYASTIVVTQTATNTLNATSGRGDIPSDAVITPPPASTVLSAGPDQPSLTALTNTHFVYFSQYALDTERTTTHKNGTPACVTSREVKDLGHAFAMAYYGDDPDGQAVVTGDLSEEFLKLLPPHLKLAVGVFTAEPTLIVPVQIDYVAEGVLAVSQTEESSAAKGKSTYPLAYSSAFAATSWLVVPGQTESPIPASAAPSLGLPRPPIIFLKPTGTSSIAVTNTQLATNFYIVSSTSTSARVEVTQVSLYVGPNSGPTKLPVGGSPGAKGDDGTGSGSGSGSSGSGGQGSNGNSGTGSNGDSSGGSNGGPSGDTSTGGSNGGTGSGSNNNGGSGTSSGSTQNGGSSGGSNPGNRGSDSSSGANSGSTSGEQSSGNSGSKPGGSNSGSGNPDSSSGGSGGSSGGTNSGGSGSSGDSSGGSSGGSLQNGNSGGSSGGSGSSSGDNGGSGLNGGSSPGSNGDSQPDSGSGGKVIIPVPVIITIGSTKATINPGSTVIIGTQTLAPQGAAVTIGGTRVSIGPTAVVVGVETHTFQVSTFQAGTSIVPTAITYGGSVITQAPVPVYNVGGIDVHAGEVLTISGTIVSAAPSGGVLAIGSDIVSIAVPNSPITLSTAGRQVIVNPTPAYVVGGQTLAAGGPAVTVDGTRLSLAPSATAIVVGSETSQIAASANPTRGGLLTIGSKTFTADASTRFALGSDVTLIPGGSATVDGKTVHLGPSGFLASLAVVDGVTQTLSPPLITPKPAFYLGGNAYGTDGGAAFVVDGQVLTPGGAITVSGTPISFVKEGTAVVVGGYTQRLPQTQAAQAPVLSLGGQSYTAQAGLAFVVDGQTLTRGGAITVSGTKVSYASEGTAVVVNGVTQALGQATPRSTPVLTIGGESYTARTGSNFVIDGATLIPGGQVTVDGTTISLASGGTAAVVNGVTQEFSQATAEAVLSIGGQTYTAHGGPGFVIGSQTLIPGQVITVDGTTVSLENDGTAAVVNGVTQTLSSNAPTVVPAAVLTIGGKTYTAHTGASYVIGDQTLLPGSAVTIDGTTISLQSGGTAAVVNGVTESLSRATAAAVLNIAGKTYTAQSGSFVIGSQTLKPGAAITVDGTTVSLEADETVAVVNGVTETLAQITAPAALTFGGHTYAAQTGSSYVIDGKTLTRGGILTLAGGTTVSLASSGSFIVINGVTSTIPPTARATATSVLTVGGKTYTASSGSYIIGGQTLTSGGVVTLLDGTTLSLGASVLVINGQTSTLPTAQSISPGVITIGNQKFTSLTGNTAAPSYVIGGQTLRPSSAAITVTMSGTTYIVSLGAGSSTVEIEVLGSGGTVISTIYETLRGSGIGASTVTATDEVQAGDAPPTSRPSLTASSTKGGSASLQNAAPRDGVIGISVAFAAIMAGTLAILL